MTLQEEAENFYLVRRFSEIVRNEMSDEPLSIGLATKVDSSTEREDKGKYYVEEAIKKMLGGGGNEMQINESIYGAKLAELETKSRELQETWVAFQKTTKAVDEKGGLTAKTPDMNAVRSAIRIGQDQLEKSQDSAFGTAKKFFGKSAQCLENHNFLFAMLPSGDKYTSVFTGAFSSIVKATVTHQKITKAISDGFDEISDQVRSFYFAVKRHPQSEYIKYYIALFYFELFNFLICIMREWYRSSLKRLSKSFGSSFLEDTVQGTLKTLGQYTARILAEADRSTAEFHSRQIIALGELVFNGLISQVKSQRAIDKRFDAIETSLNRGVQVMIVGEAPRGDLRVMGPPPRPGTTRTIQLQTPENFPQFRQALPSWTRETILAEVDAFSPCMQSTADIDRLMSAAQNLAVSSEISIRIHTWVTNLSSDIIWIEGPYGISAPSHSTLISAFMLYNVRRLGISTLAEFCQYDPKQWETWDNEKELLKVVYSLIHQAGNCIPESLELELIDLDFSSARFKKLDGNVNTLLDAIKLLADLISIGPSLQFCIVDGLQLFDGQRMSTLVHRGLEELVAVLINAVKDTSRKERVFKVLLATDGMVGELANAANNKLLSRVVYDQEDEDELLNIEGLYQVR